MAITSKKVFLEPSVFFAFIDRAHPKHDHANAYFRFFAEEQYQIYTDLGTIVDTYNLIYKDISPSLGKDFLRTISLSNLNIIYPDETDHKAALKALITYASPDLTFHKSLIAVLANKRGIMQICTFDYLHQLFGLSLFYLPI